MELIDILDDLFFIVVIFIPIIHVPVLFLFLYLSPSLGVDEFWFSVNIGESVSDRTKTCADGALDIDSIRTEACKEGEDGQD